MVSQNIQILIKSQLLKESPTFHHPKDDTSPDETAFYYDVQIYYISEIN